jgi:hypothetical protein
MGPEMTFDESLRGIGRTTAEMLETIAMALKAPDQWVPFRDHALNRRYWWPVHARELEHMAKSLNLTIDIKIDDGGVYVMSPIGRMRAQQNKSTS